MNVIERVKMLPSSTRRLLSIGIILALVVALPLFIWGVLYGNFNLANKAASGEPTPSATPTESPIVHPTLSPECGTCGGIRGIGCREGLICRFAGSITRPDELGTCVNPRHRGSVCRPNPTPTPSPSLAPTASPTLFPTPSDSPSPMPQVINLLIKFAGVTDGSADGAKVVATFQSLENTYVTPQLTAYYQSDGIYQIAFAPSNPLPNVRFVQTNSGQQQEGVKYIVSLKGEKHLKTKFCTKTGIITRCSDTTNSSDGISFDAQGGTWDFTAFPLEPGDVYPQDGKADETDFAKIKDLLSRPCSELSDQDKLVGDLDYSGCVNVRDAFLMRQTLQTRYDEN